MMKSIWKFGIGTLCLLLVSLFLLPAKDNSTVSQGNQSPNNNRSFSAIDSKPTNVDGEVWVSEPVIPTLSPAVSELPTYEPEYYLDREINPRLNLSGLTDADVAYPGGILGGVDPLLTQQEKSPAAIDVAFLTPILNFDGQGFSGVNPPDTVGDVGPNHYIQIINGGGGGLMVIYDKAGNILAGPTALESFGSGACASGLGDGIVLYDRLADRWMVSEFADSGNHLCVYISQGPNPVTSGWYAYDFTTPNFPDYPKYGVWPDAYYVSSNEDGPSPAYALDRTKMLVGAAATSQRFTAPDLDGFGFQALIPSDLDGATAAPAGTPNYFMRHRDDEAHNPGTNNPTEDYLEIWPFHVDFGNPGNSTFTGPINIPIAEFDSELCGFVSYSCFPQQGSSIKLDPLREVIMQRLQYRNFGAYEVLVGNFVTDVDGTDHGGVRWFELRKSGGGSWALYQEGTYAPDANNRWMGSISMDGAGNIALGYNVSGSNMYPSLRYAGRLAADPLGTLPQGEGTLINGSAANSSIRYGDYSAMSVDPADECTFWFTGEYNASSTWSTRIGTFKFDNCGSGDFTISATPPDLAVCSGTDAVYAVNIGQISGFTDNVTLSSSGGPVGTNTTFSPNPVTPPGSSQMTISNIGGAAAGNHTIDIIGNASSGTHSTQVDLDVYAAVPTTPNLTSPANNATDVTLSPTFTWTAVAETNAYSIQIATDAGFTNIIDSASGLNTTTYNSISLNPQTTYYWRVWAENICGAGSYSAVYSFQTGSTAPDILYCGGAPIGFENGSIPPSWSISTNALPGGEWLVSTDNSSEFWDPGPAPEGSYYASANDDVNGGENDGSVDYLYTNIIDLSSVSSATLAFQYHFNATFNHAAGGVQVSPDGGATWDAEIIVPDNLNWQYYYLNLDAYAGNNNVKVRFHSDDDGFWAAGYAVDNISLDCTSTPEPDIQVDPTLINAQQAPNTSTVHNLEINNLGNATLNWLINEANNNSLNLKTATCDSPSDIPWVTVTPGNGTIAPAGTADVDVTFNSAGLAPGNYSGILCVESNDYDEPTIEVTLQMQVNNDSFDYHIYLPVIFN